MDKNKRKALISLGKINSRGLAQKRVALAPKDLFDLKLLLSQNYSDPSENPIEKSLIQNNFTVPEKTVGGESYKIFINAIKPDGSMSVGMLKPFHSPLDDLEINYLKANLPIKGWSILATKNIFHAAGLGNNVERVHLSFVDSHTGEKIPVTVHTFLHNESVPSYDMHDLFEQSKNKNLKNFLTKSFKGLILDYLTHNHDRHPGNVLMIPLNNGGFEPLFIDHDKNFQYAKPSDLDRKEDVFTDYLGHKGFNIYYNLAKTLFDKKMSEQDKLHIKQELNNWWNTHKKDILNSFNESLKSIKNESLKNFLKNNFEQKINQVNVDNLFDNNKTQYSGLKIKKFKLE